MVLKKRKALRMITSILVTPVIILFIFMLLLYLFQSHLIYFPTKNLTVTPEDYHLDYESISFTAQDGITLSGWWIPSKNARGTMLICHGNGGNISHRLDTILIYHKLGMSVFIFDYRGYGKSSGRPSEWGTYRDSEAAWQYLTEERHIDANRIIIFGRSLGGAVACQLAVDLFEKNSDTAPKALILESTFTSIPDMGAQLYPFLPIKLLARINYPTIDRIGKLRCPVLILHSPHDDVIPYEQGRTLYEKAKEPKRFIELRGGHNDGFMLSNETYILGIDRFISDLDM